MKTYKYSITSDQMSRSIVDTVKVINHYSLSRKDLKNGFSLLHVGDSSLQFNLQNDGQGCVLTINSDNNALVNEFVGNLDRVVNREVVFTQEVLNKNPYKIEESNPTYLIISAFIIGIAVIIWIVS